MSIMHESTRGDLDLLVRAAESYYIENKTQAQIAEQLGISPSTVSRLLSRARDEGIVRINIIRPWGRHPALEQTLCQQFALNESIVVSVPASNAGDEAILRCISTVAASYIDALIKPGMVVGIGRGRMMAALVEALQPLAVPRHITIVQVMGEYDNHHSATSSAGLTRLYAEMYAGVSYYLNAPALAEDPALAELLLRAPGVSQVMSFYDRVDVVLAGVGPLYGSPLEQNGLIHHDQIERLEAVGAVGDICGHFFTSDGRLVDNAYPGRIIGISSDQIRRCPCVVAAAAGDAKVEALHGLLKTRLLHMLVTNERTAQQILKEQ